MGRFVPRLSGDLPPGWLAKESLTIIAPDGQANIIASSEALDESIDTGAYAGLQGQLLRDEFPGYSEFSFEAVTIFGGQPGFQRHFEWTPPNGPPVTQIQLYYAELGRG